MTTSRLPEPYDFARALAARTFNERSKPGKRNVEVHLSEADLAGLIAASVGVYDEQLERAQSALCGVYLEFGRLLRELEDDATYMLKEFETDVVSGILIATERVLQTCPAD